MTQSSIMQPTIHEKQLARSTLEIFHQSDADLFPSRLTLHTLQSWYDTNPTNFLSHHIYDESTTKGLSEENLGTLMAFAMKAKHWEKLIRGELEEHEITSEMILQQSDKSWSEEDFQQGYGIHIWHIERSELWKQLSSQRFRDVFWSDLQRSVSVISLKNMNCIGFSALCATKEGTTAISKLEFERKGCFDFTVQNPQGQRKVIHSTEQHLKSNKDEDGWETVFECGMYVKRI